MPPLLFKNFSVQPKIIHKRVLFFHSNCKIQKNISNYMSPRHSYVTPILQVLPRGTPPGVGEAVGESWLRHIETRVRRRGVPCTHRGVDRPLHHHKECGRVIGEHDPAPPHDEKSLRAAVFDLTCSTEKSSECVYGEVSQQYANQCCVCQTKSNVTVAHILKSAISSTNVDTDVPTPKSTRNYICLCGTHESNKKNSQQTRATASLIITG